jgi:CPA2 family monovalent cation:H+ antiporter-2
MPHDTPLISTIVAGLVLAFLFGAIANRFRMPPLVGYLVAGVLVGPHTPGFVADSELATELSEIGVILLMFGVGLHFSLKDLLSVRAIALPGAIVQIAGATALGMGLALLMGWSIGAGLIFGLALSVASTVVLLKALQDRHMVESEKGRIAVGWLIVEDIAMVLALVLIPTLAGVLGGTTVELHDPFIDLVERLLGSSLNVWGILGLTVVKLIAFVGFMLVVGRRVIPWILHLTAHTGSRELFRLALLAIALGVAAGASYLFGVSLALGAFFAGMILSESELSNRAAQESLPFRDAFAVLFFVSVGMLFDPRILIESPLPVIATVLIILVGKSALAFLITSLFRQPTSTGIIISASLAQIGEFSFILAALGVGLGILPVEGRDLILAGALISIVVNPLFFALADMLKPRLEARAAVAPAIVIPDRVEPALEGAAESVAAPPAVRPVDSDHAVPTSLSDHVVLIGYGRVGTVVAEGLKREGTPFLLIEDSEARVAAAQAAGIEVVVGNAATGQSLVLANVAHARMLLIAIPNAFEAGQAVEQCHKLNPRLMIVARAHSDEEDQYLKDLGANEVIMGEREIGLGMLAWTNGDAERSRDAERAAASMAAVAAALKLEQQAPEPADSTASHAVGPAESEPFAGIPPEQLEAAIEAAHPEHEPSGPAEPPELVPALGEMPDEPAEFDLDISQSGDGEEATPDGYGAEAFVEVPVTIGIPEAEAAPEPDAPETLPGDPVASAENPVASSEPQPVRVLGPATTPASPFRSGTEPSKQHS